MTIGRTLPPDIQEQMQKQNPPPAGGSAGGIGGKSFENANVAQQRNAAMGRREQQEDMENLAKPPPVDEQLVQRPKEPTACTNTMCNRAVEPGWTFCPKCGRDQQADSAEKKLGIKLDDDDIQDYLFKGYIVRDLKILGKHSMTVRSSQAKDLAKIDDYILNGQFMKNEDGSEKQVSDFMIRQMNALCLTAMAVHKIDGASIGESLAERVVYLEERGSAFVDILAGRVTLFNRAITEHLKKEDALLGS